MRNSIYSIVCATLLLTACESGYKVEIVNDTKEKVLLNISPSMLDFAYFHHREKLARINISKVDSVFTVLLLPNDSILFYAYIGMPSIERFPYVLLEVEVENNKHQLVRKEILDAFVLKKKKGNNLHYVIHISTILND